MEYAHSLNTSAQLERESRQHPWRRSPCVLSVCAVLEARAFSRMLPAVHLPGQDVMRCDQPVQPQNCLLDERRQERYLWEQIRWRSSLEIDTVGQTRYFHFGDHRHTGKYGWSQIAIKKFRQRARQNRTKDAVEMFLE